IEKEYCLKVAKNIYFQNRMSDIFDAKFSNRNSLGIIYQGKLAELIICRLLSLPCRLHFTYPRNAKFDTFDCTLPGNFTVDVKSVLQKDYPLLVQKKKDVNFADIYVLVKLELYDKGNMIEEIPNHMKDLYLMSPKYDISAEVIGFALKEDIQNANIEKKFGKSEYYVIKQDKLMPLSKVLEKLEKKISLI